MSEIASVKNEQKPASSQVDVDQGISPGEIFRMLWRHKVFIVLCALACFAIAEVYVKFKHPIYEATASVRIDPGRISSLGLGDLGTGSAPSDSSDLIHTEIAMMQSDGVALRTLRDLPENEFAALTGESKHDAALPDTLEALTSDQSDLLSTVQTPLIIKQEEGTSIITLSFRDQNPKLAADVVNHLVSAYIVQSFVDRDRSVAQLNGWLSSQMASIKSQVNKAQQELADFEQKNNVLPTENSGNSITDQLRVLSEHLTAAQSDRIVKEGQLRAAQTGDLGVIAALFPTTRLQALQGEEANASTKYQQLHSKFGANYPPLMEAQKQLSAIHSEVAQEVQAVRGRLQEEYNAAKTTEDLIRREYDAQTAVALAFDRHETEYAVLQAEVTSSRTLYDTLRRNLQQAGINAQVSGLDTMPVDYAYAPSYPVEPKRNIILGGGLALGLFAGIAAALILEASSDKLHGVPQLVKVAPYPVLGLIPDEPKRRSKRTDPDYDSPIVARPGPSNTAEAYRALRNYLVLRSSDDNTKTFLITGPSEKEHAGEVATNLAVALAQVGRRVLLVDADFQQPSLHQYFGMENGQGLSDALSEASSTQVYRRPVPSHSSLVLVTAGTKGEGASDTLTQLPFRRLLQNWKDDFDFVLIKPAPLLKQSSGLLVAHWVDRTLVVTRYQVTELKGVRELHVLLDRAEASVLGTVVGNVPNS